MKGGFEPTTLESQVEHSTTEPKPLLGNERPDTLAKQGSRTYGPIKQQANMPAQEGRNRIAVHINSLCEAE